VGRECIYAVQDRDHGGRGGCCCEHGNTFLVPFQSRNFFSERAAASLPKWAALHEVNYSEMSESA
jgi:hypothetical protein